MLSCESVSCAQYDTTRTTKNYCACRTRWGHARREQRAFHRMSTSCPSRRNTSSCTTIIADRQGTAVHLFSASNSPDQEQLLAESFTQAGTRTCGTHTKITNTRTPTYRDSGRVTFSWVSFCLETSRIGETSRRRTNAAVCTSFHHHPQQRIPPRPNASLHAYFHDTFFLQKPTT